MGIDFYSNGYFESSSKRQRIAGMTVEEERQRGGEEEKKLRGWQLGGGQTKEHCGKRIRCTTQHLCCKGATTIGNPLEPENKNMSGDGFAVL